MPISEHPIPGTIIMCDFKQGFREPEMTKRRAVVVVSPKIAMRPGVCTVVCLSTTAPDPKMPYHAQIDIRPKLPDPLESDGVWIKGDMIYAVGFHRLDLIRIGKKANGDRIYRFDILDNEQMKLIKTCVLRSIGLNTLTRHL